MKIRRPATSLLIICTALLLASGGNIYSQPGSTAKYQTGSTAVGFEPEINAFLRRDSVSFPPPGAYLFTGSSTIRKWENLAADFSGIPVIQRGFGGSDITALNFYLRDIVLPYKPKVIVVYEGDNDLASGMPVDEFIARCDTLIRTVHRELPKTRIYLMSVKPSFARRQYLAAQAEANKRLQELARKSPKTGFIDITPLMYDGMGRLRPDLFESDSLHVNQACYRIWAVYMKKAMHLK